VDKKYIYYVANNVTIKNVDYGENYVKDGDTEDTRWWVDPTCAYFIYTGESIFDYYCISIGEGKYQTTDKIYVRIEDDSGGYNYQRVLRYEPQFKDYYHRVNGKFEPLNFLESNRYKKDVVYWEKATEEDKNNSSINIVDGYKVAKVNNKWEFMFYDTQLYVYVPIRGFNYYATTSDKVPNNDKTYYLYNEKSESYQEATENDFTINKIEGTEKIEINFKEGITYYE
jgi:hypothetical protein